MTLALYVIVSTFLLLLLSARLREAHGELARLRDESDQRAQAVRDECAAYAQGVAMTVACLLAGLAAARWCAPASGAHAGTRSGGTSGQEAGR